MSETAKGYIPEATAEQTRMRDNERLADLKQGVEAVKFFKGAENDGIGFDEQSKEETKDALAKQFRNDVALVSGNDNPNKAEIIGARTHLRAAANEILDSKVDKDGKYSYESKYKKLSQKDENDLSDAEYAFLGLYEESEIIGTLKTIKEAQRSEDYKKLNDDDKTNFDYGVGYYADLVKHVTKPLSKK